MRARALLSLLAAARRPVNGHFWVFYASLTDVEFTLAVTDTTTNRTVTYHNPPYHMASHGDTAAF
jgi:hypothetical protein